MLHGCKSDQEIVTYCGWKSDRVVQCSLLFRFETWHGQKIIYSLTTPRQDMGPNEITFLRESGLSARNVKLTTHLHLVSRIEKCNDIYIYIYIYILPFRLSWCTQGQIYLDLYHLNNFRSPVTTAWRVLRLRIEERPPIRRVAANKLNKQSRTADGGWSSSLGIGQSANNQSLEKLMFRNTHRRDDSSGDKTIRR